MLELIGTQFIVGTLLFAVTLALEAGATIWLLEWRRAHLRRVLPEYTTARGLTHITVIMMALMVMHLMQMTLWAVTFSLVGATDSVYQAMLLSMSSFSTLGFASALRPGWELLAAIEGVVGSMMMGWSAGILLVAAHSFYQSVLNHKPAESVF